MKTTYLFLFSILILVACTETVPIQSIYTGETNWVPGIELRYANYHRFEISWWERSGVPLEVERNVSLFLYELRKDVDTSFSVIDSQDVKRTRTIPTSYTSGSLLGENVEYSARVSVLFRDGTIRSSNEVNFLSPAVKGKVLKRITIPDDPNLYPSPQMTQYQPYVISFYEGYLYGVQLGYLTRLDTSSGEIVLLTKHLRDLTDHHEITDFSIFDNSVYLPTYQYTFNNTFYMKLIEFNIATLQPEDSLMVALAYGSITTNMRLRVILNSETTLFLIWDFADGTSQIFLFDIESSEVTKIFPIENNRYSYLSNQFTHDGTNIWISRYWPFDNQISHFDPNIGITDENVNQVPVFEPYGLAWDGSHFWTFEPETRSFVKLELEGI